MKTFKNLRNGIDSLFFPSEPPEASDANEIIAQAWSSVGANLQEAIDTYKQEEKEQK